MGAWIEIKIPQRLQLAVVVAPLVGAWIEIVIIAGRVIKAKSLPSWERGLKFESQIVAMRGRNVAPLVGAWIEIGLSAPVVLVTIVAPLVGAWIEIG